MARCRPRVTSLIYNGDSAAHPRRPPVCRPRGPAYPHDPRVPFRGRDRARCLKRARCGVCRSMSAHPSHLTAAARRRSRQRRRCGTGTGTRDDRGTPGPPLRYAESRCSHLHSAEREWMIGALYPVATTPLAAQATGSAPGTTAPPAAAPSSLSASRRWEFWLRLRPVRRDPDLQRETPPALRQHARG